MEIKTCACLSVSGGERYASAAMATKCTRSSWNFSIPSILRLDYSRLLDVDPLRNVFSDYSATLEIGSECTFFFNPALHAAAAASEAEEKETKMRALAPSPGTLTVVVFYV